eukprot:4299862-Prymnesium_polylepis.1
MVVIVAVRNSPVPCQPKHVVTMRGRRPCTLAQSRRISRLLVGLVGLVVAPVLRQVFETARSRPAWPQRVHTAPHLICVALIIGTRIFALSRCR